MKGLKDFIYITYLNEAASEKPKLTPGVKTKTNFPQLDGESDIDYIARLESYMVLDRDELKDLNKKLKDLWIDLPYKTQIYNKGAKNKDFWITRKNMYNIMSRAEHNYYELNSDGKPGSDEWRYSMVLRSTMKYSGVLMDLAPDDITYAKSVGFYDVKDSTNDFTKLPDIKEHIYTQPFWGNNDNESKIITRVLNSYSKYFKSGKLNVEFIQAPDGYEKSYIYMKVVDPDFIKDKEEKISKLIDPQSLKDLKDGFDKESARLAAEAEKKRAEAEEHHRKQEEAITAQQKADEEEKRTIIDKLKNKGATEEEIKNALKEWGISKSYKRSFKGVGRFGLDWYGD